MVKNIAISTYPASTIPNQRIYLGTGNGTITLSTIPVNGLTNVFTHQGPTGGTGVRTLSGNMTINPSTSVGGYTISIGNNTEMMSHAGGYLAGRVANNASASAKSKIVATLSSVVPTITAASTTFLLNIITMNSTAQPNKMSVVVTRVSITDDVIGNVVLATDATLTTLIMSVPITMTSSSIVTRFTSNVLLNPTTYGGRYYIGWIRTSTNDSLQMIINAVAIA